MKKSVACRDTALPKISWCKTCQHFEEGVEFERERIIKMLEDERWHDMVFAKEVVVNGEVYRGWRTNHSMKCRGCKLIALIKGEK